MKLLALAFALLVVFDDDTYTVTLTVKSMHCDECVEALKTQLKALKGWKSTEVGADKVSVAVTLAEKQAIAFKTLQRAVPGDMKLEKAAVSMRGVASQVGTWTGLEAKGSGEKYEFVERDPKKPGKLADLRKAVGKDRKKMKITGELATRDGKECLILDGYEAADWKDE